MPFVRFSITSARSKYSVSRVGGIMSLHYKVYADFIFTHGKPQLVKTSLYSTTSACTTIPVYPYLASTLTISRIFSTLEEAKSFITYLHGVYPKSPAPPPVLDGGQKELFSEVL
jgi:hypothetical protein